MGYFDFLTSSYFKTAPDGRKLFFPWGVLGRGYAIGSEQDYLRLHQQIKIYMIVSLVLVLGSASLEGDLVGLAVATLLIGFYAVWSQYLLRRRQRSDERLSLQEAMASRARLLSPVVLWLVEIGALAFVGAGVLIFIVDPRNRLIALVAIVFFGLWRPWVAHMIVLRRRASPAGSNQD